MLAVQADGQSVEIIENPSAPAAIRALQQAFFERAALECGCCTPGMILQAAELLTETQRPPGQSPSRRAKTHQALPFHNPGSRQFASAPRVIPKRDVSSSAVAFAINVAEIAHPPPAGPPPQHKDFSAARPEP